MLQRLLARDFTDERFGCVIRRAMKQSAPGLKFNPDYYFPFVWNGIASDLMVVWSGDDSLLVGMFYPQIFTGEAVGVVSLWAARGSLDALPLLRAFEEEAYKRRCVSVHASSFGANRADAMARLYGRCGYRLEEMSFMKKINQEVK